MFLALYLSLFAVSVLPSVYAHGYMAAVAIDGTWYPGSPPANNQGPSPIRLVSDISPVKGSDNPDLKCGLSSQNAEMVVPANPGSVVSFLWRGGGGGAWPHNTGPVMTYMASCGSTPCDQFDATNASWFKIDQAGQASNGTWLQAAFLQGTAYQMTIPSSIPPGGYLIRNEIIALQLAVSVGGAEFYPACAQLMIGGNGNGQPSPTVSFPGAYSDTDPGIYDPDVYNPGSNYTFPGGPVSNMPATNQQLAAPPSLPLAFPSGTAVSAPPAATGAAANGNGSSSSYAAPTGSSAASSTGSPAATPTSSSPSGGASQGSSGHCMLKRQTTNNVNLPRHYSRVMRRIMHGSVA